MKDFQIVEDKYNQEKFIISCVIDNYIFDSEIFLYQFQSKFIKLEELQECIVMGLYGHTENYYTYSTLYTKNEGDDEMFIYFDIIQKRPKERQNSENHLFVLNRKELLSDRLKRKVAELEMIIEKQKKYIDSLEKRDFTHDDIIELSDDEE